MEYVFWLIEGRLGGRPGPVEAPWDAAALRAGGIEVVISLNSQADPEELAAAGLVHYVLPMPPLLPLTHAFQDLLLRSMEPVLERLHQEVSAGHSVLIHCHAGKDRTGLVMAAYLVRYEGLDVEQAIEQVRAVRPIAMSTRGYLDAARRFAEQEEARRREEGDG
jgi:protein-tyrosine phosphatase